MNCFQWWRWKVQPRRASDGLPPRRVMYALETYNTLARNLNNEICACHPSMAGPGKKALQQLHESVVSHLQAACNFSVGLIRALRDVTIAQPGCAPTTQAVCKQLVAHFCNAPHVTDLALLEQVYHMLSSSPTPPTAEAKVRLEALMAIIVRRGAEIRPAGGGALVFDFKMGQPVGHPHPPVAAGANAREGVPVGRTAGSAIAGETGAPSPAHVEASRGGALHVSRLVHLTPATLILGSAFWAPVIRNFIMDENPTRALTKCGVLQAAIRMATDLRSQITSLRITIRDVDRVLEHWRQVTAVCDATLPRELGPEPGKEYCMTRDVFGPVNEWHMEWQRLGDFLGLWCEWAAASDRADMVHQVG